MYITQKCFEKGFYFLRFGEYEEKVLRSNGVGHWSAANHGGEYLNDFSFPFKFLVEHLQIYDMLFIYLFLFCFVLSYWSLCLFLMMQVF